jgi:uroporphyrinogen III methyltransferase/synthase
MAEAMVQEFPEDLSGKKILLPRAKEAREVIVEKMIEKGASINAVTAYQTQMEDSDAININELLKKNGIDIITFTSSSTVRNFIQLTENFVQKPDGPKIACIGPITAQTASEHGMTPDIVANENTIEALAASIAEIFGKH